MCGRFTLIKLEDLLKDIPWLSPPDNLDDWSPRYNIAPSQPILAVTNDGRNKLDYLHWGLIPSWAKDPAIGNRMINARAESLADKPAFRSAFRRRRCLIPADGFYEWQKRGKTKAPMHIRLKTGRPFMLAGLWETWHSPDGSEIPSCTIITTEPNDLMRPIHDRMPAILTEKDYTLWLDPAEKSPETLSPLLHPYASDALIATEVSRAVNNPNLDNPTCLAPADAGLWNA